MILYIIKNNFKLMFRNKLILVCMVFGPFFVIGILSSAFESLMKSYEPVDGFQAGYQIEKDSFWGTSIETIKKAGKEAGIELTEYPEGEPEELLKSGFLAGFVKLGADKYTVYENANNETEGAVLEYFFSQCLMESASQVMQVKIPGIVYKTIEIPVEEIDYMPAVNSKDYYGITEIVYFSFLGVICMAEVFASEKKNGIDIKFRLTSLTEFKLYIAKWLPSVLVVAVSIGAASVLSATVFGIHWGNLPVSALVVLLLIIAGISFGLMLYAVTENIAVTVIILFSSTFFMGFFGGTFETYMYSNFSDKIKNLSPVYHVNRALVENSCMGHSSYNFSSILYMLAIIVVCTCVALLAGWAGKRGKVRG